MKDFKYQIIIGIILIVVTTLVNWLVSYGNKQIHKQTIEKITDSVVTYKKRLNDTVEVLVTERFVYSQTIKKAKAENELLKSRIGKSFRTRNVQSTSTTLAEYTNELNFKIEKISDSAETYKAAYKDLYRTYNMMIDLEQKKVMITDTLEVPINQIIVKTKTDYLQYKFIHRWWTKLWEQPKLKQVMWSDNPNVKIKYQELILIDK